MLSAVVLRPFSIGIMQFSVGEIVTDASYVSLFQQEQTTYGQNVILSDFSGEIDVTPVIPLTPLQSEVFRAKSAESTLALALAAEQIRAETAEGAIAGSKGQPNGTAALDSSCHLLPLNYAIHPGQVLDAAATAFASITGASVGGFLASQVSDASAGDGTYTAVYVYPVAPPNGRLWGLLSTYLQSLGLTAGAATTTLNAIWTAAAAITP